MNENERALEALGLQPGLTPPASEGGLESGAGAEAPQSAPADFTPNFLVKNSRIGIQLKPRYLKGWLE